MARALPTGTVTFLFTDIEGSTRAMQEMGPAYPAAHAMHARLLRDAFARHGGVELRTEGDSFFVVFERARDAAAAAVEAQVALAEAAWDGAPLTVRIGLHTGEAPVVDDEYVGIAVHKAARVADAANGGQILLSRTTRDLIADEVPDGAEFIDLGEHRLKDLSAPVPLVRLMHPAAADPRPPRSLSSLPNNLPTHLTTFIGRAEETASVRSLLDRERLVTITGAGGSGKTRLALQVAAETLPGYPDGAWLIDLAQLSDPALIPSSVVRTLGMLAPPDQDPTVTIRAHLSGRRTLLVLDNCEHLIAAVAQLTEDLVKACPNLTVLITSREPLGVPGEVTWRIPSLGIAGDADPVDAARRSEAVTLFTARAAAVRPGFEVTAENAGDVLEICRRLDGIPLAIELAAARLRALSPSQIVARMDDRFRLLTGSARSSLPRQQTLRAVVDWSHSLLTEPERIVFRRLAVFVDGFTLDAAEQVCSGEEIDAADVLDLVSSLLDKSLLVSQEDGDMRYRLLETLRQYGQEKLLDSGEADDVRRRHLAWVEALVRDVAPTFGRIGARAATERIQREYKNVRAAIVYGAGTGQAEDAATALGTADLLAPYWINRVETLEGARILRLALAAVGATSAAAVSAMLSLAEMTDDMPEAIGLVREARDKAATLDEPGLLAKAMRYRTSLMRADGLIDDARAEIDGALRLAEETGDEQETAWCLLARASLIEYGGDKDGARRMIEEVVGRAARLGLIEVEAAAHELLSGTDLSGGQTADIVARLDRAIELQHELGSFVVGRLQAQLAYTHWTLGDLETARRFWLEADEGLSGTTATPLPPPDPPAGRFELAEYFVERFRIRLAELGSVGVALNLGYTLALLAFARGDAAAALDRLDEVAEAARPMNMPTLDAAIDEWRSHLLMATGRGREALTTARRALAATPDQDEPSTIDRSINVGEAALGVGEHALARDVLVHALDLLRAKADDPAVETSALIAVLASWVLWLDGDRAAAARLAGYADAVDLGPKEYRFPWIATLRRALRDRLTAATDVDADDLASERAEGARLDARAMLAIAPA